MTFQRIPKEFYLLGFYLEKIVLAKIQSCAIDKSILLTIVYYSFTNQQHLFVQRKLAYLFWYNDKK